VVCGLGDRDALAEREREHGEAAKRTQRGGSPQAAGKNGTGHHCQASSDPPAEIVKLDI
jgi:hypothetical protein